MKNFRWKSKNHKQNLRNNQISSQTNLTCTSNFKQETYQETANKLNNRQKTYMKAIITNKIWAKIKFHPNQLISQEQLHINFGNSQQSQLTFETSQRWGTSNARPTNRTYRNNQISPKTNSTCTNNFKHETYQGTANKLNNRQETYMKAITTK